MRKNPDFSEVQPLELYERFLLITLGTGSNKSELKYSAKMASKWGILSWLYDEGSTPLVTCYNEASSDMVAYHNCAVFEALQSENNYLRIDVSICQRTTFELYMLTTVLHHQRAC